MFITRPHSIAEEARRESIWIPLKSTLHETFDPRQNPVLIKYGIFWVLWGYESILSPESRNSGGFYYTSDVQTNFMLLN